MLASSSDCGCGYEWPCFAVVTHVRSSSWACGQTVTLVYNGECTGTVIVHPPIPQVLAGRIIVKGAIPLSASGMGVG